MSRSTFYSRRYIGWPPIPLSVYTDPDSYHWNELAETEFNRLVATVGQQDADAWWNEAIPDPEALTWHQIYHRILDHWKELAEAELNLLRAEIGDEAANEWFHATFPNPDDTTWSQKYSRIFAYVHADECSCVLPEQHCPVCQAAAQMVYKD